MERLTMIEAYDVLNSHVPREMCSVGRDGYVDDYDGCRDYCESVGNKCKDCAIQECFNRLAKYEDTGLTPEKILEMDRMYQELGKELMAYRKIGTVAEVGTHNESVKKRRNTVSRDIVYCWHCGQAMEINRSDAK